MALLVIVNNGKVNIFMNIVSLPQQCDIYKMEILTYFCMFIFILKYFMYLNKNRLKITDNT